MCMVEAALRGRLFNTGGYEFDDGVTYDNR